MGTEEPRITTQTLKVLAALISGQDESSGAEIGRNTKLASGTLYPILMRLEEAGWVQSRWEMEDPSKLGRPRRRFYKVTGIGVKKARAAVNDMAVSLKEFAWR